MATLSEEQRMLRDTAKNWVQARSPVAALRRLRDAGNPQGYDESVWREIAAMGWAGIVVPEDCGGSGFGYLSMGLVLEQLGRTLTASPLLASGLAAASALTFGGSEAQKRQYLPGLADGALIATLAVDEGPHHAPEMIALTADRSGDGYRLNGTKSFVLEGMAADLLVVAARTSGRPGDRAGIGLFLIAADAPGVTRRRLALADSRGVAGIAFDAVRVGSDAVLGDAQGGWDILDKSLDCARAGLAAEMLGSAVHAFETTLEYLRTRVQFGQLIGSFQALQHRAARMFTDLELARSAVEAALMAIDADQPDRPELVSLAKAKVADVLHLVSNEMVQMHGGIAMTDAHDAGFYLKRARSAAAAFGNQAFHRNRYAQLMGY